MVTLRGIATSAWLASKPADRRTPQEKDELCDWWLATNDKPYQGLASKLAELTQEAALHIYNRRNAQGQPEYAGIRYVSRLKHDWECWAIFADRARHRPLRVDPIAADDPYLHEAARILGLAIEDDRGRLITPS